MNTFRPHLLNNNNNNYYYYIKYLFWLMQNKWNNEYFQNFILTWSLGNYVKYITYIKYSVLAKCIISEMSKNNCIKYQKNLNWLKRTTYLFLLPWSVFSWLYFYSCLAKSWNWDSAHIICQFLCELKIHTQNISYYFIQLLISYVLCKPNLTLALCRLRVVLLH
jgi:hypothetical protein